MDHNESSNQSNASIKEEKKAKERIRPEDKELLDYGDLEALGYGSRTTIWRAVRIRKFPAPIDDGRGNPRWTREMVDEHKKRLQPFVPKNKYNLPQRVIAQ